MEIEIPEKVEIWEALTEKAKKDLTAIALLERTTPQKHILRLIYSELNIPEVTMSSQEYEKELEQIDE
ncbi:MAG: hypothetical protein M1161_02860 [Candidatus Thermoplasmatota archaeon]|jgi:hypothetical protein|nr:hypothetical protein [Candidatus Thermoplasmatota archaeon]